MTVTFFDKLTELQLMALTAFGEARGQGLDGMLAVASVILNRARFANQSKEHEWWGKTIGEVCLKDKQFSCFNKGDVNREILEGLASDYQTMLQTNAVLKAAQWICRGALEGHLASNVGAATHYHSIRARPAWAAAMHKLIIVGEHVFYSE
jgi:spore germination cell wall hydrolase CwlJ-like protein